MQIKFIEDKISIGLPDAQIEKIIEVFSKYQEVESAIVFGSRAKGNYKYNSDIDIAIKGDVSLTLMNDISIELDELDMPLKIDLIIFNNIDNQELIEYVERVGMLLYNREK